MTSPLASPRDRRVLVVTAGLIGLLCALWVRSRGIGQPTFTSDFDQVWAAARAWLAGRDPYAEIGPGAPFEWKWPLYYPFPAVLLVAPLAGLPVVAARMAFAGISAAAFTWAIGRDGWSRWPILLSMTFFVCVDLVQWPLLLASAYFLPWLGGLTAAKPNFAVPVGAAITTRRSLAAAAAGAGLLLALSLVLRPGWPADWLANLADAPHFRAPVQRPAGFLLLLALLRWRRPEARWLLGLALVPQAPSFYDQLLLVIVCLRAWEAGVLALSTWALFFIVGAAGPQPDYAAWGRLVGNWTVWLCYLPCLAMVLRRPNVGEQPAWLVPLLPARWRDART